MWVKRTEAEIAEERKRQRRGRLRAAMLFGAFVLVMVTCSYGGHSYPHHLFVPANELTSRLPFAAMSGIICAFAFYKWGGRKRPMMICPQCETTKYEDGVNQCPCGGHFELMESMKFVA